MSVRALCGYCAGRADTKMGLQRKGFRGRVRAGRLFSNLRLSMNIEVGGGNTVACVGVVVEPNIEKSGSAVTVAQNSRNPRQVRCSTVPADFFWRPHSRTEARTSAPAIRADPFGPAPISPSSRARGCTTVHDCSPAPPMRSRRARATHAPPQPQNAPAESAR